MFSRLASRTFGNLLRDTAAEFVGAASRRLFGLFVNDVMLARLQRYLGDFIPDWLRRLLNPPPEDAGGKPGRRKGRKGGAPPSTTQGPA